jgi:hypothetical protein
MLDQWLTQLAEEELEKTANSDLEKALDSMSIPELKAYYSLLDKTAQEATPPLPAKNVPALETPPENTPPPPPPEDQIAAQGQITPAEEVPPGPLTPEVQAAEAKVQEAIQLYQAGQIGDEELQAAIDNYNQLTNTAKVAHAKFAAADLAGRTIAHNLFKQAAFKKKELNKQAGLPTSIIGGTLGGAGLGALGGGMAGGISGAYSADKGDKVKGFWAGAKKGLLPGAIIGGVGGGLAGAGSHVLAHNVPAIEREFIDPSAIERVNYLNSMIAEKAKELESGMLESDDLQRYTGDILGHTQEIKNIEKGLAEGERLKNKVINIGAPIAGSILGAGAMTLPIAGVAGYQGYGAGDEPEKVSSLKSAMLKKKI